VGQSQCHFDLCGVPVMSTDVKCLACGCVFSRELEMCPRRYLSPHDEEAMRKAAERILDEGIPYEVVDDT
jgi:hypothetical protein